jgi:hypothetical protein
MAMKSLQGLALAAALAALTACATGSPYRPATSNGGYGYTDQRLEENRFRLSFNGSGATDRADVEDYLLYRAAELTLASGYDYFVIDNRATDARTQTYAEPTFGRFGPSYGFGPRFGRPYYPYYANWTYFAPRWGWRPYYDPFWDDPITLRQVTRFRANAEVLLFKGPKPAENPRAFDARDVQTNLRDKVFPAGGPAPAPR